MQKHTNACICKKIKNKIKNKNEDDFVFDLKKPEGILQLYVTLSDTNVCKCIKSYANYASACICKKIKNKKKIKIKIMNKTKTKIK